MARIAYCLVCAVLIGVFSFADAAAQVALSRKKLPVYYNESGDKGILELEFSEKHYKAGEVSTRHGRVAANVVVDSSKESVGAEEVVLGYLNDVLGGEYEQLGRFYVPGAEPGPMVAAAQDLRRELAGLAEVRFLSEWFYSSGKFVLARLMFDSQRSRVVGFGFQVTVKGFLLSDDWGRDDGPVLGLFQHVLSEMEEGRTAEYSPRPFDHSIEVLPGIFGITINVDGRVHDPGGWLKLGRGKPGKSLTSFVELVLGKAGALDDTAFTSLWCKAAQAKLRASAEDEPFFSELRRAHVAGRPIKHVMTMDFAEHHAHYFVEQNEPRKLRTVFVARERDRFCLSEGPDYAELRRFLVSEPVKRAVWRLWPGGS